LDNWQLLKPHLHVSVLIQGPLHNSTVKHGVLQRRLDKATCTKYQIVELAKESLLIDLL